MAVDTRTAEAITALAQRSLPAYCIVNSAPDYDLASHVRLMLEYLAALERGEFLKLMVFMPPQNGKSTHAQRFVAHYMGRHPREHAILASYGQDLASRNGRIVRSLLAAEAWPFEVGLAYDSRSVHRWGTSAGGGLVAVGVGGGLTGNPGHLIVIDDPHKDREEADSPVYRDRAWNWWTDVVQTRRAPRARELFLATRWHEDDLPGRVLRDHADEWVVLSLAAMAEPDDPLGRDEGDPLWPDTVATLDEFLAQERSGVDQGIRADPFEPGAYRKPKYPLAWLEAVKRTLPARSWAALYQQRPVPQEGAIIRKEWLQYWTVLPPDRLDAEGRAIPTPWTVIQTADTSWDEGVGHDPSAIATWGTDGEDYYLLDYWTDRVEFPDLQEQARVSFRAQRWRPTYVFVENKANGRPLIQQLARTRVELPGGVQVRIPVAPFEPVGSKIARLEATTPLWSTRHVFLPTAAPWLKDFVDELTAFPTATHDETADTTSSALLKLAPWLEQNIGRTIVLGPEGAPETSARRRVREWEEKQAAARKGPQWPRQRPGAEPGAQRGPARVRG